jgi:hypothetical protein
LFIFSPAGYGLLDAMNVTLSAIKCKEICGLDIKRVGPFLFFLFLEKQYEGLEQNVRVYMDPLQGV